MKLSDWEVSELAAAVANRFSCLIIPFLTAMAVACAYPGAGSATRGNVLQLSEVERAAKSLHERPVRVAGVLVRNLLGGYYLYGDSQAAESERYEGGVDIVSKDSSVEEEMDRYQYGSCVVVSGIFTKFYDSTIVVGYFRSKVGYIVVDEVSSLDCF